MKEKQTSQVNELSTNIWAPCNRSFDVRLSYEGQYPVFPTLSPLRVHRWGGCSGLTATTALVYR